MGLLLRLQLPLLLFLATLLLASSHADFTDDNPLKLRRRRYAHPGGDYKVNCQSFRLGVEANNLRDWSTIPTYCKNYIKSYMEGKQYGLDLEAVARAAADYAHSFSGYNTYRTWVFDVEETLLSNIKYLNTSQVQYGSFPIDREAYYEWLRKNPAAAIEPIRDLFDELTTAEFDVFLISEAPESFRADLTNLLEEIYVYGYNKLILRGEEDMGKSAAQFKAEKRAGIENGLYTIVGNVGDQWSDLTGENAGARTFKVPNPVYYIP